MHKIQREQRQTAASFAAKSKRGNILVPALFLLMFFVIMGSVLLGAGESSVIGAKRSYESKQAYYSAKSAVDVISQNFQGEHMINELTNEAIKSLADATAVLNAGNSVSSQSEMFGSKVKTTITCLSIVPDANKSELQKINVSAEAQYGATKRVVSRDMEIRRRMNGLPAGIFGVAKGAVDSDYTIEGVLVGTDISAVRFNGSVRIENAKTVIMNNVNVYGDLYINAKLDVRLKNVVVYGNLYINGCISSPSSWMELYALTLGPSETTGEYGDAIITSSGQLNFVERCVASNSNFYIKAPKISYDYKGVLGPTVAFKNIYLTTGTQNTIPANRLKGNLVTGDLADAAYEVKMAASDTNELNVELKEPHKSEYEYIAEESGNAQADLDTKYPEGIDTTGGEVKIELVRSLNFITNLKVKGGGTVNLYCTDSAVFNKDFVVERVDGLPTVVNFIIVRDKSVAFQLSEMTSPLQANLIAPWSIIHLTDSTIQGTVMAAEYRLSMSKPTGVLIDATVDWAYTGSLDIGVGSSINVKLENYK